MKGGICFLSLNLGRLSDNFDKQNTVEMTLCQYSGPGLKGLGTFLLVLAAQSCHIENLAVAGTSV